MASIEVRLVARRSDLCSSFLRRLANSGGSSESSAVRLASFKHGPDDPRVLVGDSNRCAVEAASLSKLIDPGVIGIHFGWRRSDDGARAVDQETAQMLAPAFRYAHQDLPIAAGELARDQPHPGSKMSSVFELGSVADGRNDRRGRLGADSLDGGDAPAWLTFEEYSIDLLVERGDTPIEVSEEIVKL